PEGELDPAAAGEIRAGEEPGDEDGKREGEKLAHERHSERVDEGAAETGLAERGAPAVETVAGGLPRRGDLKALEGDEDERKHDAQGDGGEDHGAEHG